MKQRFVFALICAAIGFLPVAAQERIMNDPEIRVGKLENGMTYYLRHNSNPKGCADFYIAHNVGALQEEDNQNGLAHFLEHMAFNGTKNYPGRGLLDFLAKDGVRFGYNVNAYTSRKETVYNLSDVPLVRESFVDSVLLILHDWSCNISCEQDALDAERGVISEEWRRRDEVRARMGMAQTNLIYKGAKHAERSVIGTLEIINGFKREEILDFYEKWYRPDLQAVIIVGDFDVDVMEAKVRKMFASVPVVENPVPKEEYLIPALDEPLFENITDPDIKFRALKVLHRLPYPDYEVRQTDEFWKQFYVKNIITTMVATRLKEVTKKSDCLANSAVVVTNSSSDDFYTMLFTLTPKKEEHLEQMLEMYEREIKRAVVHGFSSDEFEVAKSNIRKRYRLDSEISRESIENEQIVKICIENFLRKVPMALPDDLLEIQRKSLNDIEYDDVMAYVPAMLRDCEKIYTYNINSALEDKLPSKVRMQEIIENVRNEDVVPEFVEFKNVDLVKDVTPGKIVKTVGMKKADGEIWTLDNGAKVYWLPVDEVKSGTHLVMQAIFDGGYNSWDQKMISKTKAATSYIARQLGFGSSSSTDISNSPDCSGIRKMIKFEKSTNEINLSCGKKDVETAFAMLYNFISRPNFDGEKALSGFCRNNLKLLRQEQSSAVRFSRESNTARFGDHPWIDYIDTTDLQTLDMRFLEEVFERCFGNPEDLSLLVCTDLSKETVLPLVEKYVASLKRTSSYEKSCVRPMLPHYDGEVVLDRTYPLLSAPKVDVSYQFLAKVKDDARYNAEYDVLDYIMSQRCVTRIREERGGTYHVRFYSESYFDEGLRESYITFQTRPEMADVLVKDAQDLFDDICSNGPSAEEIDHAVKYLVKAHNERKQKFSENLDRRMSERRNLILHGVPFDYDYEKILKGVSRKSIQNLARKVNNGNRFIAIYREQ